MTTDHKNGTKLYNIGLEHYNKGDFENAFLILTVAATRFSNALSMKYLGIMYQNGTGTKKDVKQAIEWYEKAADNGIVDALNSIGTIYQYGYEDIPQDYEKALIWFLKAAHKGNSQAVNTLGAIHEIGYGRVKPNYKEALFYYSKLANAGNADGQSHLRRIFLDGIGTDKDQAAALKLFEKSFYKRNYIKSTRFFYMIVGQNIENMLYILEKKSADVLWKHERVIEEASRYKAMNIKELSKDDHYYRIKWLGEEAEMLELEAEKIEERKRLIQLMGEHIKLVL